jgi:hypothetical protein
MFEFGITAEFFALARPELDFVPYRFAVAAADPPPLRGSAASGSTSTAGSTCCARRT